MIRLLAIVSLAVLFQGCATVTTGSSQSITIETTPSGAICTLSREGNTIGAVNPTPGTVTISKDMDPMEVKCELENYTTSTNVIESGFQGATLGNVLLGGGVGLIIDAASGAMNEYPKSLQFRLRPVSFSNMSERDKYFEEIAKEYKDNVDALLKTRKYRCSTDECKKNVEKLNKQLEQDLAKNEADRMAATYKDEGPTASSN